MDFGDALRALRSGNKVAREGWNGVDQFIILVPGSHILPVHGTPYYKAGIHQPVSLGAHLDMKTSAGNMQPGWLASQADMLSADWYIVD
jgi:hypothetical protein